MSPGWSPGLGPSLETGLGEGPKPKGPHGLDSAHGQCGPPSSRWRDR